ncbi:gliding motility protein GldC [Persicobacter psychrovividus]|uniref:Gliding motility protein GldC n=1 Tax=Persicobacter psychrovividus TaxID=387638 RepID=A0ABN6L804_9BACT|nr:gliding motility protein GldC [Persicobacter psychrovividus]
MKKSTITLDVNLDEQNIPETIEWNATDGPFDKAQQTHAFSLSIWDKKELNSLRIDLWDKEMPMDQMKRFCIDTLGGMAQTVLNSTGDEKMAEDIKELADKLMRRHIEEMENGKKD